MAGRRHVRPGERVPAGRREAQTKRGLHVVVTPTADINRLVEQLTSNTAADVKVDEIIKDRPTTTCRSSRRPRTT